MAAARRRGGRAAITWLKLIRCGGFASTSAGAGESVETTLVGVFDIKKTASQAWAIGDKVYWDNVAKEATKTSTNNTLIGAAIEPVGNSASETTGRVRLNGSV